MLKHCPDCGRPMKWKEGDWEAWFTCPNGHRYHVTRWDYMGGSSDELHRLPDEKGGGS